MSDDNGPVEVHLPDGGRVVVSGSIDAVLEAVVHASGSEADVEAAIRDEAENLGMSCSASGRQPTVLTVGKG
jgi:hypothetical protein